MNLRRSYSPVEITRTQAGVRLDLNLEKGRIRDELSAREVKIKEVGELQRSPSWIVCPPLHQLTLSSDPDTRIESEISNIRASMEGVKVRSSQESFPTYLSAELILSRSPAHTQFGILQYIVGSATGLFALLLGTCHAIIQTGERGKS